MTGKEKCKLLKTIRQEIAESNGIVYLTSECTYEGECRGTCPKCDAEIRYLDSEIKRLSAAGVAVTLTGISMETLDKALESAKISAIESCYYGNGDIMVEKGDLKEGGLREMTIEELDLSVRSFNCLKRARINTVEELCEKTEDDMMKVRNLGKRSLDEVRDKLRELGLDYAPSKE